MKINFLILLLITLFISCAPHKKEIIVELKNNIRVERKNELVVIPRSALEKHMGKIADDEHLVIIWQLITLPLQYDDMDKDGKWDELAFQCDLLPMEDIKILIKRTNDPKVDRYPKYTNIRFAKIIKPGVKYQEVDTAYRLHGFMLDSTLQYPQFEGPGWENNLVAFRNYFDERNGIDIFGKVTFMMILDSVGIHDDYHVPNYWGMDILKVGNSLGAGALGIYYNDSLYRVSAIEGASYYKITEGPVRSVLDLNFEKLTIGDLTFSLKHRITITTNECGYRSDVTLEGPTDKIKLVSGIVNLHSDTLYNESTENTQILYTHDKQSELKEYLGLALLVKKDDYAGWLETPKEGDGIINTYAVKMNIPENKEVSFRFYAGWEITINGFNDRKYFGEYLNWEAQKFESPVLIKFL
jgi:hypothetical protein